MKSTSRSPLRTVLFAALAVVLGIVVPPAVRVEAATSFSISWQLPAGQFRLGVDHVSPTTAGGNYEQFYEYPSSVCNNQPILPNPVGISSPYNLTQVRLEFYKGVWGCGTGSMTAGVAIRINPPFAGQNIGMVQFPTVPSVNGGRFLGRVLSSSAVTSGRVGFEIFQTTGQQRTNTGYLLDAFTAGASSGSSYATGPLWNGQYILFITDKTTGRQAIGLLNLSGDTTYDIDLDAWCFGMDECQFSGSLQNPSGKFHPLSPSRIVDTRRGVGISTAVKPGDGRLGDPNPVNRLAAKVNHEFMVTGKGGVPTTGVSAVLANVTVISGASAGSLRLFPKPPRTSVFQDQSSFPAANGQSPGVYFRAGDTRASMQLLKVGVGGRIRLDNVSFAAVHVIVDVVGWVDSTQPSQGGSRLVPVSPARVFDTRNGTNTTAALMANGEQRLLPAADGVAVPADATAVLGVLTSVNASSPGFDVVWPAGLARPAASSINTVVGTARSNMASAPTDANGDWSVLHAGGNGNVIFDVAGYATAAAGSGGVTTPLPATRLLNPTSTPAGTTRSLKVAGVGGVPASGAKGAFLLVTSNSTTSSAHITVYSGAQRPTSSNVNWVVNAPVASLAFVPIGADGTVNLFAAGGTVMTVDLMGWVN
ncbi:MAG: hypothetical protein RL238_1301 [Actinomycetota bacterium]|jgi:hypothetical protein